MKQQKKKKKKEKKVACAPSEDSDQHGPIRSESSLCAQWVAKDPRFLHADSQRL